MLYFLRYFWYALLVVVFQVFVLNQLDLPFGGQLVIAPLFIMLLPFDVPSFLLLLIGFVLGMILDMFMNTFGLTASALVFFSFLRPIIFNWFRPKEEYDITKTPSIREMGWFWFLSVYSLLSFSFFVWFFLVEIFRISEIDLIIRNSLSSFIYSLAFAILFQYFYVGVKPKK